MRAWMGRCLARTQGLISGPLDKPVSENAKRFLEVSGSPALETCSTHFRETDSATLGLLCLWSSLQPLWVDRHQCPGQQETQISTVPPRAVAPLTSNQSLLLPLVDIACFTGIRSPKRRSQKSRKKTLASMWQLKEFICGYIKDIPKTVKNKRVEAQKSMLKSYNSKYRWELWKYITLCCYYDSYLT